MLSKEIKMKIIGNAEIELGKGVVARGDQGCPGLILSEQPVEVVYSDGKKGMAWTGIHISESRMGEPWSSRSPQLIGKFQDEGGVTGLFTQFGKMALIVL